MEHPFRERLRSGAVVIADGAMGTQLYARGHSHDDSFEFLNIERPEIVEQVHREYIAAGAELIETNTFGANRAKLAAFGLEDRVRDVNVQGARIARSAREISGEPVLVAGSVGPTGWALEPYGNTPIERVYDAFHEQVAALLEGGVDLLILETFSDLQEMTVAIRAVRDETDLPMVAQMTFSEDFRTPLGHSPEQVVAALSGLNVDVVGANCSVGSSALLGVAERLVGAGAEHVSAMPNAGWPTRVANRVLYLSSPEYMADYGRRMADAGVRIIGGCCGTTPAHIRVLAEALRAAASPRAQVEVMPPIEPDAAADQFADQSELVGKLGAQRVISVEIRPPRGANPSKAIQGARLLRDAGVDAVNVLDSAMARVRMSAVATGALIKQQVGVEAILHFTTRDRNLMAIQSDLIGAHALGIRNILCLTGDPPGLGDNGQSKAVYDVDSIGLIRIVKQLNRGTDIGGNSIGTPTRFLAGAALNPTAEDLDWELSRFREKIAAGADFVMTQPVYDAELFRQVLADIGRIGAPILMGILPLQSYRHALFLHNELPGVRLTQDALRRMELAGAEGVREGLALAREMVEDCGPLVSGLYVMPSFGRYEVAAQLVSDLMVPA